MKKALFYLLVATTLPAEPLLLVVHRADSTLGIYTVNGPSIRLKRAVPVGKTPRELCMSPDGKTAYVSNGGENSLTIVDVDGAAAKGILADPGLDAPDGCAVSRDGKKLYVVSARKDTVVVFDTAAKKPTATIPVGKQPRRLLFSLDGTKLYCANGRTPFGLTVIDPLTDKVTGTIPSGHEPRAMMYTPDKKHLLVGNVEEDTITFFDAATMKPDAVVGIVGSPQRLVATPNGDLVFVLGRLVDAIGIVNMRDVGEKWRQVHTLPVGRAPWGMAVSNDGKFLFVSSNEDNNIAVIDLVLMKTLSHVATGKDPNDVYYRP